MASGGHDEQWGHGEQWGHSDQGEHGGQWTDLVMAVRILDKDITQVVQVPRLSSRVLFLTREGRDEGNDLLYEQVLYIFEGTYSVYFYRYS